MSRCDRCEASAVIHQRYSGLRLCADHLCESVEKRARKELQRQGGLPQGARVVVAYSAGKDSTVALHVMASLRARRPDLRLVALTIDEGIAGYRPPALALAAQTCRDLGVDHVVKRTRDLLGADIDDVDPARDGYARCSPCGVARRRLMNDAAREFAADALVTGHNLDDLAQSVLMNVTAANVEGLTKLAPHAQAKPGLVPRLVPLRQVPENEVYLYAHLRGLPFHDGECPYAAAAQRGVFRDALHRLEDARPGTRHGLLRTLDQVQPLLRDRGDRPSYQACTSCGEPTSGTTCKVCQFRARYAPAPA